MWGIVAAVLLGAGWYFYSRTTPEAQMRKVIMELAACGSKQPGDGGAATVLKVHRGPELFTDPARIEVRGTMFGGEVSHAQIQSHLARYRSMMEYSRISVEVDQVVLTGKNTGEMAFTGSLEARTKHGRGRISEVRELHCAFEKGEDGKWRIRRLTAQDILEK